MDEDGSGSADDVVIRGNVMTRCKLRGVWEVLQRNDGGISAVRDALRYGGHPCVAPVKSHLSPLTTCGV